MVGTGLTGFLQNFSGGEMIVILIVALVVLGPERLPELARSAGRGLHKLRKMTEGLQTEVKDVIDDPAMQPFRELGELATRPRQKLTEYALEAEAEERAKQEAERMERDRRDQAQIQQDGEQEPTSEDPVNTEEERAAAPDPRAGSADGRTDELDDGGRPAASVRRSDRPGGADPS